MIKRTLLVCTVLAGPAHADDAALVDVFAPLGCAIGPTTRPVARDAGIAADDIEAFAAKAVLNGEASIEGEWLILADTICTITFPNVVAEIGWDDPEVQAAIGAIDEYPDDPGCFLNGQAIYQGLEQARGWDLDRATLAYLQFLATGLARNELRFYSESPLYTPPGFQVLVGACADVPNAGKLAESRAIFEENFDAMVRMSAEDTACKSGETPWLIEPTRLPNPAQTNAWSTMEMTFMAMGGGWYEGISGTEKGTPRPPLCTYE